MGLHAWRFVLGKKKPQPVYPKAKTLNLYIWTCSYEPYINPNNNLKPGTSALISFSIAMRDKACHVKGSCTREAKPVFPKLGVAGRPARLCRFIGLPSLKVKDTPECVLRVGMRLRKHVKSAASMGHATGGYLATPSEGMSVDTW